MSSRMSMHHGARSASSQEVDGDYARLEDQMNNDHLQKLQQIFEEADDDGGGGLDPDEFRQAIKRTMGNKTVDDHELEILFMKVDTNCDGTVDWDEYLSYMLLEYQEKDIMSTTFREVPFPMPLRGIPSAHRDTINSISYYQLLTNRHGVTANDADNPGGRYITMSKEGVINFWNSEMTALQRTVTLEQSRDKTMSLWLTDLVAMANVNMVAISSSEREISFYDCSATKFELQFQITALDKAALTMDYWFDYNNLNSCMLLMGDAGGNVSIIVFSEACGAGLFGDSALTGGCKRIPFAALQQGAVKGVKAVQHHIHNDWVKRVMYCSESDFFLSCSVNTETALFAGDINLKKMHSFFKIRKGVCSVDFCNIKNVIATGGMDWTVRIWNPYVTTKATTVFRGHGSAVLHVMWIDQGQHIVSVDKGKNIKVWDVREHNCVQSIPARNVPMGHHPINVTCYSRKTDSIILANNMLAVFDRVKIEEDKDALETMSHEQPICSILYNDLFDVVKSIICFKQHIAVSGWNRRVVCHLDAKGDEEDDSKIWPVRHGEDILCSSYYSPLSILATSSYNGDIILWSADSGHVLCRLNAFHGAFPTSPIFFGTPGETSRENLTKVYHKSEATSPGPTNNVQEETEIQSKSPTQEPDWCETSSEQEECDPDNGQEDQETPSLPDQIDGRKASIGWGGMLGDEAGTDQSSPSLEPEPEYYAETHRKVSKYNVAVDKIVFLSTRENNKDTAILLASGADGWVRAWSIHHKGGMLGQFRSTKKDIGILTMATDSNNDLLLTGDTEGYIKVWDIRRYCIKNPPPPNDEKDQEIQSSFPFLKSDIGYVYNLKMSGIKRKSKDMGYHLPVDFDIDERGTNLTAPPLLNSFRGHTKAVVEIQYLEDRKLIATASSDCTIRLWTACGRYIGTFGQKNPWAKLDKPVRVRRLPKETPLDIVRVGSATTLKVLYGGIRPKWRLARNILMMVAREKIQWRKKVERGEVPPDAEMEEAQAVAQHKANKVRFADVEEVLKMDMDKSHLPPLPQKISSEHLLQKRPIQSSAILRGGYKPQTRHRMSPRLPKLRQFQTQVAVYSSIPYSKLQPVTMPPTPDIVHEIHARHQKEQERPNVAIGGKAIDIIRANRVFRAMRPSKKSKTKKSMKSMNTN
ncbi:WD repeat-containing protein on Y chromosome-like isoform X2 [Branchiostoma lanceolatum]|uniref:WD repeat-containing protein on Y chromosome-like isoform X2 n=1 Tax=Branchiostoma lanceolatum TaxID=7740 RepID=UPI0034572F3C